MSKAAVSTSFSFISKWVYDDVVVVVLILFPYSSPVFTRRFSQGWNSTWDRYVTDEFILKDTEENRKLQKELAEEAQLTPLVLLRTHQ